MRPIANNPPIVAAGATMVSKSPVNRIGSDNTVISASFSDADLPGIGAFTATFKIREQDNVTELTLVNNQPNGSGGLTIIDLGSGTYRAEYTYNPDDAQTTGVYDLYFEVSDGTDSDIDDYANNLDELSLYSQDINFPPEKPLHGHGKFFFRHLTVGDRNSGFRNDLFQFSFDAIQGFYTVMDKINLAIPVQFSKNAVPDLFRLKRTNLRFYRSAPLRRRRQVGDVPEA